MATGAVGEWETIKTGDWETVSSGDWETITASPAPQFTGEASPAAMSAHKPLPYTPPQLPGASAVLGPETYFGRQMAGQREDLQQAPLVDLTTMTPEPGIIRGAARFASGLTTPTNLALAAGTGMLGAAPAAIKLPQIAAGIFTVDMAKAAYEQYPEFKAAVDAGDIPKAKEIGTELVLTGAFAGLTAKHALKGPKGLLSREAAPRVNVEAEPIQPQPVAEPPALAPLEPPRVTVDDILNIVKEREQAQRAEPLPKFIPESEVSSPANVPITEVRTDRATSHAKELLDLGGTPAGQVEGFASLDIPTRLAVLSRVKTAIQHDDKVFRDVVPSIPVDVVNNLTGKKLTTEGLFGNKSVLIDALSTDNLTDVAPIVDSIIRNPAFNGAELATATPLGREVIPSTALSATEPITSEVPRMPPARGLASTSDRAELSGLAGEGFELPVAESAMFKHAPEPIPESKPIQAGNVPPGYTHEPPMAGSLPIAMDTPEQMPLPKYAGSINLNRVGADYPVRKLLRDTYDQYRGKIDEARRGVITHEETQKLAEELGMTEKQLLKRKLGKAFNAEEVTAAREILNASAQRLGLLREQWVKSGSDEAVAEFRKAMDMHAEIQAEVSGISTETGRALSAHRIISEPAKGYKKMLDVLGGRELNEEILKQFSQIDASDPRQVNAFVQAYSKVTIWDQLYEAWRSTGLLSGPITHLVNTASNLLTLSTRVPETLIGAGTERVLSKMQGRERGAFAGEVKPEVFGALAGIKPGLKSALAAWREEIPLSEARFEAHRRYIPGKLGKNIRIPYRLLSAADEMLKSINYSAESYQLAYRKARASGLTNKEAIAKETLAHLQDKDIVESANKAAQYWTFNQPLGPWSIKVNQLRETIPGARYIVPFLRTSTNIAKFGLERTPLNFARLMREYHRGNLKGVELSEEMAKPILGTMIGAATVMLAAEGYITGSGPKNRNERETLLRSGWRPYSFKIGDTYYPYGRLEPIGSVVGMAADFAESRELEKVSQLPGKIAFSISKNLTSKTFQQGMSDLNNAISDPDRWGQKFIKSYAGTLIPNLVATTAKVIDPYQRITEGPLQAMQARIPGASLKLPPKRDVLGRGVKQQGLLPIGTQSKEFIDQELVRVKAWIGDLDKKDMTAQQFDEYAQRVGKALRPRLEIILHSSVPDDIKREMAKRAASDARSQVRRSMMIPVKKKAS